jgi:hypothetical protein
MAEATDQSEAIELTRTLLETANEEHFSIQCQQFVLGRLVALGLRRPLDLGSFRSVRNCGFLRGTRHGSLSQNGSGLAYRRRLENRQPVVN